MTLLYRCGNGGPERLTACPQARLGLGLILKPLGTIFLTVFPVV